MIILSIVWAEFTRIYLYNDNIYLIVMTINEESIMI